MRYIKQYIFLCLVAVFLPLLYPVPVSALERNPVVCEGVYAGQIPLTGMSEKEADEAIRRYVAELAAKEIELVAVEGNTVSVKTLDLGLGWYNTNVPSQAIGLGRGHNVLRRIREKKELENENRIYGIIIKADREKIEKVLREKCCVYDIRAVEPSMKRSGSGFDVSPGEKGTVIDVEASVTAIKDYLEKEWNREEGGRVELPVMTSVPSHDATELFHVKDVLGTYTTSFSSSGKGRSANVRNGCSLLNGRVLYPGEQLSVYDCVSPFTEENGYFLAGSYNKGLVVETLGGGICQVSSTLYNAVLRSELQVDQRSNHSMVVGYVDISADAAISGTSKDFKFTNNTSRPIYIQGYTTEDKQITFTIYGSESRPAGRTLSFETEILSEEKPEGVKVTGDPSQPVGYSTGQSAHTGYRANYWKIVMEDGVEKERVKVNTSDYQAVARTVTFGTAGDATGAMRDAIKTQNVEHCRQVAQNLVNSANAASIRAAQEAAQAAAREAVD